MVTIENKIAIGCLVQWYEIEMVGEYLQSVKNALDVVENRENITVDLFFNCDQTLEKIDEEQMSISDIHQKWMDLLQDIFGYDEELNHLVGCKYDIRLKKNMMQNSIYTIADYRRDFNSMYCDKVDLLMWGESDSLIPRQTFVVLNGLNNTVQTPKYVAFFATCKMWDDSWSPLEHPEFTDKPFIDMDKIDTENWWSLRYNMSIDEMNKFNDSVEQPELLMLGKLKFNGCGLVISSEVIKSGVNIPQSAFFIHEDTAFMNNLQIMFQGTLPQYVLKNILLVHNRKHAKKRMYIKGEGDVTVGDVNGKRATHDWYTKANKLSEWNAHNLHTQQKFFTWTDVLGDLKF
jgi:hypothetical protein